MMHQKHPKIARPNQRTFGRTAFSLVGTNCKRIEDIMADWLNQLSEKFRVVGVTGDHGEISWGSQGQHGSRQWMSPQGNAWNEYDDRLEARQYDLALVNGNHYPAEQQIVFIDAKKAGTLERRAAQLTNIAAIVKTNMEDTIPDWLKEKAVDVPVFELDEVDNILKNIIIKTAATRATPLKALLLIGGKSSRMGQDKSSLIYRGEQTEAERITNICQELGLEVFHSVQQVEEHAKVPQIADRFLGLGPMGAIASAFLYEPETAWLVLACDLPLLEKSDIEALIEQRDQRKFATAIQGIDQVFPEPLIAIYEPRAYERLLRFLSLGYACPRKLLINSDIATSLAKNENVIANANTPAERQRILEILAKS